MSWVLSIPSPLQGASKGGLGPGSMVALAKIGDYSRGGELPPGCILSLLGFSPQLQPSLYWMT